MPLPTPYQPVTRCRFCVQANTQGIARRSPSDVACVRRAGREPKLSSDNSSSGLESCRYAEHLRHFHQLAVGRPGRAGERLHRFIELVHRNQCRFALRAQHMLDHRGAQELDLIRRRAAVRVLEGHHLALLGDPELAANRTGGEAAMARPAGAPPRLTEPPRP